MDKPPTPTFFQTGVGRTQKTYFLEDIPLTGKIPEWLNGFYLRNGPGQFQTAKRRLNHWFDAMGALHRFGISGGKVSYGSRFIDCRSYQAVQESGDIQYSEFATDPCRSIFRKAMSHFIPSLPNMTDNPKIHVARIDNQFLALGETPMMVEFDPATLERTGGREIIPGGFAYKTTAHPHFEEGHAWNLVVKFGMRSFYRLYDLSQPGRKPLASVPVKNPAYLHGFGMSENYFIIAAGPLTVNPVQMLFWKKSYIEHHHWRPEEGAEFIVIEKKSGKVAARVKTDPFFCFHHVNAWEEKNELVMDINAYDDASIVERYYLRELENPDLQLPIGTLRRFRLDLRSGKVKSEKVSEACIELPRIDYHRYNTRSAYAHVYGVSLHPGNRKGFYNSLVKIHAKNGESRYWHEEDCYPGEPLFIPGPQSRSDEEGILLSIVLDAAKANSFLLILDAETMEERARATVPEPIVYGFHGEYFESPPA